VPQTLIFPGAANGMGVDGSILSSNEQAKEVWVGATLGYAGMLMSEGMKDEAYKTTWGLSITSFTRAKATGSAHLKHGISPATSAPRCTCVPRQSGL
jgi:hypothetical protein